MKYILILFLLPAIGVGQTLKLDSMIEIRVIHPPYIKWQQAKEGTKPYYRNKDNPSFVCDSVEDLEVKGYSLWIKYLYDDTVNHPLLFPCNHRKGWSARRKKNEGLGYYNYCNQCNKKTEVYYYPIESIILDDENQEPSYYSRYRDRKQKNK